MDLDRDIIWWSTDLTSLWTSLLDGLPLILNKIPNMCSAKRSAEQYGYITKTFTCIETSES